MATICDLVTEFNQHGHSISNLTRTDRCQHQTEAWSALDHPRLVSLIAPFSGFARILCIDTHIHHDHGNANRH